MPMSVEAAVRKNRLRNVEDELVEAVDEAMEEAAGRGFQKSQELVPIDTSELLLSGTPPYRTVDGEWVWAYDAPHTLPVEFGSRPHWAPIQPLLDWARRVLGDESAGYAVQQKIAQEGTDPQPFIRPGFYEQWRFLKREGVTPYIRAKLVR